MAWDPAKHPRDPRTGRFIKVGAALAALRGESGTSAPAVKFPKTAAKRAGSTDSAVVREKAFALVDAADTAAAHRIAAGLKGKQLQAVADALGTTLYGRTVDEKRSQLVQSAIGAAFNSAAIRFSVEGDRGDTAARRAELAVERERFLRDYRNRTRQRVIDNTGGAAGAPTYQRLSPTREGGFRPSGRVTRDEAAAEMSGTVAVYDVKAGQVRQVPRGEAAAGLARYARSLSEGTPAAAVGERRAAGLARGDNFSAAGARRRGKARPRRAGT